MADEVSGNRAVLIGDHAIHLARVLRARVGQEFDVATDDTVRRGRVIALSGDRVEFELGEEIRASAAVAISLVLSIFKFDRMEWAIEKCTELGVSRIIPVVARRTDSHLAAAAVKRSERWQRIARQAAEQSRRAAVPEISLPIKISEAIKLPGPRRIVLAESEDRTLLRDVLQPADADVALAIGPEGGWTEDELEAFRQTQWISASLGDTILRAETAAIAATAVAVSALL
jgi:16S rRNA (uracil1498-N3)-methyltransferase